MSSIRNITILVIVAFCVAIFTTSCTNDNQKLGGNTAQLDAVSADNIVVRGEYLVTIMGYHDCHSPKAMGTNGPK